jgi:hypothetical protein
MAKTARPESLRDLARRRLQRLENMTPEERAQAVEEANKRGRQLLRFANMVVEIRDI